MEMDLWDQEAIDLVVPGFIEFGDDGTGEFGFIAVRGWMDCRPGERGGRASVEFSWQVPPRPRLRLPRRARRAGTGDRSLSPAASMSRRQPEHGTGGPVRTGRHRSSGSHATTTIEVQSRSLAARGEPQHFLNFFPLPQGRSCPWRLHVCGYRVISQNQGALRYQNQTAAPSRA